MIDLKLKLLSSNLKFNAVFKGLGGTYNVFVCNQRMEISGNRSSNPNKQVASKYIKT